MEKVDIVVEKGQIVEVADVHNLADEIPYQTMVVVVPLKEHLMLEKALMEEELEVLVVAVVVVVVVDRLEDREKGLMVNV